MKSKKIQVFYTPKQVNHQVRHSFSKSPLKPMLVIQGIDETPNMKDFFEFNDDFKPFRKVDFKIAHTRWYVDSFFRGENESNGIPFSKNLAESVCYTNASLYNAIRHAYLNPEVVCFSPTSGFHHAQPSYGGGFCTFSGQVIAAVKMYREFGVRGAFLDLDGHYGNSIEDSREYVKDLNEAIPVGFNINPRKENKAYIEDLKKQLLKLKKAIIDKQIDYVVWCHGADSHSSDDLGGQVSTKYWLQCSELFYSWVRDLEVEIGRSVPVAIALFGGYRRDDYQSVINLHLMDLGKCIDILLRGNLQLDLEIKEKKRQKHDW